MGVGEGKRSISGPTWRRNLNYNEDLKRENYLYTSKLKPFISKLHFEMLEKSEVTVKLLMCKFHERKESVEPKCKMNR